MLEHHKAKIAIFRTDYLDRQQFIFHLSLRVVMFLEIWKPRSKLLLFVSETLSSIGIMGLREGLCSLCIRGFFKAKPAKIQVCNNLNQSQLYSDSQHMTTVVDCKHSLLTRGIAIG